MINITKSYLLPFSKYAYYLEVVWERYMLTNYGPLVLELETLKEHLGVKHSLPYLDRGIYYLPLQYGKAKYTSEIMTVCRQHTGGAWSGLNKLLQLSQSIDFYQPLKKHLTSKASSLIKGRLRQLPNNKLRWNIKANLVREIFADARVYGENLF